MAGMVQKPEDYRWCSLGLIKKAPKTAKYLLTSVQMAAAEQNPWEWYKSFVYESGGVGSQLLVASGQWERRSC
jgi:hypothetical protein